MFAAPLRATYMESEVTLSKNDEIDLRIGELEHKVAAMDAELTSLANRFANIVPTLQHDTEYATKSVIELAETLGHNSERLQEMRAVVDKVAKRNDRLWQALSLALGADNGGDGK